MSDRADGMVRRLHVEFGEEPKLFGEVFLPKDTSHPVPGAILCHGLGSGKETVSSSALNLAKQGVVGMIFDFRGHGHSQGIFDGNDADDVVTAWEWLSKYDGIDPDKIAIIGHSTGARSAILAAGRIKKLAAVVAMSCPPDIEHNPDDSTTLAVVQHLLKSGNHMMNYPKDGILPWLHGAQAVISRLWMLSRGYRLHINWQSFVAGIPERKISPALTNLDCLKLFVHARGDKYIPYQMAVELYETAAGPKEIMLGNGGSHATPLMPGDLRKKWTNWVSSLLTNGKHQTILAVKENAQTLRADSVK